MPNTAIDHSDLTGLKRRLADLLASQRGRWVTTTAFADRLNLNDGYIRRILNELVDEGYALRHTDDARYVWTYAR